MLSAAAARSSISALDMQMCWICSAVAPAIAASLALAESMRQRLGSRTAGVAEARHFRNLLLRPGRCGRGAGRRDRLVQDVLQHSVGVAVRTQTEKQFSVESRR